MIVRLVELWAYPQSVSGVGNVTRGEIKMTIVVPEMPNEVKDKIDELKKGREKYISDTYPELFS